MNRYSVRFRDEVDMETLILADSPGKAAVRFIEDCYFPLVPVSLKSIFSIYSRSDYSVIVVDTSSSRETEFKIDILFQPLCEAHRISR